MQLDNMFSEQKWNILRELSHQALSPLQLSERLDTTMANVSQQLRLLEAVNLVQKQKIRNRDKGKPRSLFSLSGDYAFLVPTMNQFADKQLLELSDHHKRTLKIWFVQDRSLHYDLQKLYWTVEDQDMDLGMVLHEPTKTLYLVTSKELDTSAFTPKSTLRLSQATFAQLQKEVQQHSQEEYRIIVETHEIVDLLSPKEE